MLLKKKDKDKRWKCLKELDTMSDDDILALAESLEKKSLIMQLSGISIFFVGTILMFVVLSLF